MCDFPSWIEEPNGNVVFLTDGDLVHFPPEHRYDAVGHQGLRRVYPRLQGIEKEGFPPPLEIRRAINRGQMRKLAELGGYQSVKCTATFCEGVSSDGSWWQERYKDGNLHGVCERVSSDGSWWQERYKDGKLISTRRSEDEL